MKILYISSACCYKNKEKIDKTAKIKLENNIIKFHNLIIKGLSLQKENIEIESIIGLPVSIKTNKKIIWERDTQVIDNVKYTQIEFINIPIVKQASIALNIYKYIKQIIRKNNGSKIVIIYDASFVSVMPIIQKIINKYEIRSIGIFADIYDYMSKVDRKTTKHNILKKISRNLMKNVYNNTFAYVFLTKQMNDLININKKPYIIMEGLVNINENLNIKEKTNHIIYAGSLYEKYGVKNLIEAFKLMNNQNYELHIYGDGELVDYIKKIKDKKIKYFGIVNNEIIEQEETKAILLVNPRFTNEEYTKYSFPSKNMEYMASGTPLLTTRLPGMPEEYYKYVYCFEDESIDGMKRKLEEILSKPKKELMEKGKIAKNFVDKKKNIYVQAKRIIQLINKEGD